MIEMATKKDVRKITDLWKTCFGDTEEYIDFFIKNRFSPAKTLVKKLEGVPVSMLFLLDGEVKISGECFSSIYIYAACTHPDYRKRGFMESLIERSKEYANENAIDFIALVPANEGLFSYYKRFGFESAFQTKEIVLSRRQLRLISALGAESANPQTSEIVRLRNRVLSAFDSFLWDEDAVNYALNEHYLTKGKSVFAKKDGRFCGYALFHDEGEAAKVKELIALNGCVGEVTQMLLQSSQKDVFILNLPVVSQISCDGSTVRKNAMLFPVSKQAQNNIRDINNAYFGLTLG